LPIPHRLIVRCSAALLVAVLALSSPASAFAARIASVFGGRVGCIEQDGLQLCEGSVATRVESFDGVPLDVTLTLPSASTNGPWPLIVQLHGWSQGKTGGLSGRARAGYAVLTYTARGFHASCGSASSRTPDPSLSEPNVCVERGWTHLADARFEAHDTQHLIGLLVDEGIVDPAHVGVTGASYGGGQSLMLAALNDRTMLPNGRLIPWRSPNGVRLRIAAAAPIVPWSDLASALSPNGRTLDYRVDNPYGARAGIQKQSWNATLYGAGAGSGYYAPEGADPSADLNFFNARVGAGEPYDTDPAVRRITHELSSFHSAYGIDDSIPPAPLLIYNAWTDDLFPVDEAVRYWRHVKSKYPDAEIALHFADGFGHPRAGLGGDTVRVQARIDAFFARHLLGHDVAEEPAVETYTQACGDASVEGPFTAESWDALHPGEVRLVDGRTRRFDSKGGDPEVAAALDPLSGPPCRTVDATDDANAATYRLPAATGDGYTLLGAPTVIADLSIRGRYPEIASRLWDVAPDGTQTLVAHDLYRPRDDHRRDVFQLHPNGWHFRAGHVAKLELLGQSVPYGRASNGTFSITVNRLELRLPVREAPDGDAIAAPATHVLPAPETTRSGPCRLAGASGGCRTIGLLHGARSAGGAQLAD
jgi:predicted acyl esterase